tara:strand:- start:8073 stop:8753 length:681 start_codon:yes stop_codon:yes gene_type:complete
MEKHNSIQIIKKLKHDGIYVLRNFLDHTTINDLKISFEKFLNNKNYLWNDSTGSDSRIFGIDLIDEKFKKIFETDLLNSVFDNYISSNTKYSFVMANKVIFKSGNLGSGGGWHRDTFFQKQLKFIVYLSDVNKKNGAFEYIPKSHFKSSKIFDLLTRLSQKNIRRYANKNYKNAIKYTGSKGDLLIVDTSGVHRGSPIEEGVRYALTNYLSHKQFSASLTSQLVSV